MNEEYKIIKGIVKKVIGKTHTNYGSSRGILSRGGGQSSELEIEIEGDSPVKKIYFKGCWPIEKGDNMNFKISMRKVTGGGPCPLEVHYRDILNEEEDAEEIEKLRAEEVVATYINKY